MTTLDDDLAAVTDDGTDALLARVARWEARAHDAEAQAKRLTRQLDEAREEAALVRAWGDYTIQPPRWVRRKTTKGEHIGTPCLMLSDTHFDEVVDPAEVNGQNAYDRAIAEMRLQRTLEGVEKVTHRHLAGLRWDGFALFLGGDIFSGDIHDELAQTNEGTLFEAVVHWEEQLAAFIGELADLFGRVHAWGVVGNHGRTSHKPRAKKRAQTNVDWLLYTHLARHFQSDDRVTFTIPEGFDVDAQVHDTRFRLEHGDNFRGGSGIAGMLSPLMLGRHRRAQAAMAQGRMFDWLMLGHWHSLFMGQGLIVNGSLKGIDEYASQRGFSPEPPAQAFWITTPEHGVTFTAPIFPMDAKREGWA